MNLFVLFVHAALPPAGQLHGIHGFNAMSHRRAVVYKATSWPFTSLDMPPPPFAENIYDTVVKLKYTGFLTPGQSTLLKVVGAGGVVAAAVAGLRSKL